mgnify:CR=1 FL=1
MLVTIKRCVLPALALAFLALGLGVSTSSVSATYVEDGKATFAKKCAMCHGATGAGDRNVGAPSLHRLPPNTQNITVISKPGLWWRIKAGEVEGWVLSRFLQEMSGAPAKATEQAHEGYAYQYSNETAYTEADASSCARACRSSPNCNALTFFKSRKLCRLMTRMDALLEANPDAVSIYMAKNVQ